MVDTLDDGNPAFHRNIRAHPAQLVYILKPVLPNPFGNQTGALSQAEQSDNLGLHIGGEAGMGTGLDIGLLQGTYVPHPHGVVKFNHLCPNLLELGGDAFQMLGDDVFHQHVSLGSHSRHHIGPGLNLVGNDGVFRPKQVVYPPDFNHVGSRPHDVGAHGIEEVGQIHNVGFLSGVFNDGHAPGFHRRQHDVDGGAHRHHVKVHPSAGELIGPDVDHAVLQAVIRSQALETLQVLVDGPYSEVASSRQADFGPMEPAQQRSQKVIGSPHMLGQLIGHLRHGNIGGIDLHGGAVQVLHLGSHLPENL